jgi:trimeric autotransporter adhesin
MRSMASIEAVLVASISMGLAAGQTTHAATQTTAYNAVTDFSLSANPNGVWSYLSNGSLLSSAVIGSGSTAGWNTWSDGKTLPNYADIGANVSGNTLIISNSIVMPTNVLLQMDPEATSNVTVRFTAPAAGIYSIVGNFLGIDTNQKSHPVDIMHNGVAIFTNTISAFNQIDPFNLTATLSAGDFIDFVNETGSTTYEDLSTGLSVTITTSAVPPTVTAVVNAANFQSGPVAPGEIVTIGGVAIGPATAASLTLDKNGNVVTSLAGVQVLFNGFAAPLTYVSSTQINAVVPYQIAGLLSPSAQVIFQGQTSKAFPLTPASSTPALFTANGSGTGPAAILNQDNSYNAPNNPAARGSYVVVYATGEGQTSPAGVTGKVTSLSQSGPLTPQPLLPVAALIGGQPAFVAFYGEAPGLVSGVMQLNVQIPSDVPAGNLPITVSVGGNSSQNGVTVAVK